MDPNRRTTRSQAHGGAPQPPPVRPLDQYDPAAAPFERKYGIRLPTSWHFENFKRIYKRPFEHTRFVDLELLGRLGVRDQILALTAPIGITTEFWTHCYPGYRDLTLEFLSSLRLVHNNGVEHIEFYLRRQRTFLSMERLSQFLGLEHDCPQLDVTDTGTDTDRDVFWTQISRYHDSDSLSIYIEHPTMALLHRCVSSAIFSRGETMRRATKEDLLFMRLMLRPQPQRIRVAKVMVDHWMDERDRVGRGAISMCSYVTLIIHRLFGHEFDFTGEAQCGAWYEIDIDRYKQMGYIGYVGRGDARRLRWLRGGFLLPYPHPIDRSDPTTWLIPGDYGQEDPAPRPTDVPESSRTRRRRRTDTDPGPTDASGSMSQASMEHITGLLQTILDEGRARDRRDAERDRRIAHIEARVDTLYYHDRHDQWLFPPTSSSDDEVPDAEGSDDDSGDGDDDDGPPHDGAGPSYS